MANADEESPDLLRLAAAVADGQAVDWQNAELSASVSDSTIIRELKALSELVAVHRSVSVSFIPDAPGLKGEWGPLEIRREIGRGSHCHRLPRLGPGARKREVAPQAAEHGVRSAAIGRRGPGGEGARAR